MAEPIVVAERGGFGLATVMARRGVDGEAISRVLGVATPGPAAWAGDDALALIGVGPGAWFAHAGAASAGWAEGLRDRLDGLASVSDQSGGYLIYRLTGEGARTALQRGAAIDFHPLAFAPGAVAATAIAHISVVIWQVDATPTYDVALFRSFGSSFRHWLDLTVAAL